MGGLASKDRFNRFATPVAAVLLGLIAGGIIMLISGFNPFTAYGAMLQMVFLNPYYFGETIVSMIPLVLTGLSVAFAFRTGLFNIGVEGQLLVGWLTACALGVEFAHLPKVILIPFCIIGSAVTGGIWGYIPGFLKARFHVHEVITTIMMNYIALYTTNAIIRRFLYVSGEHTPEVPTSASLSSPFLSNLTQGSRLNWGFVVAVIGALLMWFLLWRTTKGFEVRAVGFNPHASRYAGMNVERNMSFSFGVSGAYGGVAGAMIGLGVYHYMTINADFTGLGFNGIAVALLGMNTSLGVVLGALLFAVLQTGQVSMQSMGIPTDLIQIIMSLIIFFVASSYLIEIIGTKLKRGKKPYDVNGNS
ncbi:ABC transporter permease [Pullulanibacillus sp. KACC 23026]|uniref:ABC transporter permease n=1 Tax=Pullulanibacillus sp. KACC 23026 TaxID=3028315 RepID=UPI0023B1EDE3|nr:ABC transporter permease [Pullulanibacillus sp. KACC 23026]WEG11562.1 ABC transporter permease [Pullulanibacillus sp. KACC 23026]